MPIERQLPGDVLAKSSDQSATASAATDQVDLFRLTDVQQFLSFVGTLVSVFCLLVHVAVYSCFRSLRKTPQGKGLLSLSCALVVSQLLYAAALFSHVDHRWVCVGVAVCVHYFNLVAFLWTNALAVDFCRARLRQAKAKVGAGGSFAAYSLFAWLTPAFIVAASFTLDVTPSSTDVRHFAPFYGQARCWMGGPRAIAYFFALPLGLLLAIDAVLYIIAARKTCCPPPRQLSHHTASVRSVGSIVLVGGGGGGSGDGPNDSMTSSRTRERRTDRRRLVLYVTLTIYLAAVWSTALAATFLRYNHQLSAAVPEAADISSSAVSMTSSSKRDVTPEDPPTVRNLTYAFIALYTALGPYFCLAFVCSTTVLKRLQAQLLGRQSSVMSSASAAGDRDRDRGEGAERTYHAPTSLIGSPGPYTTNGHGGYAPPTGIVYPSVGRAYLFEGELVTRETCI